jgi:hypothetical protein
MAAAQLSLTRRALLAGACAVPVLGSGAPPASSRRRPGSPGDPLGAPSPQDPGLRRDDEVRWRKALARFRAAEAALAAAEKGPEEVYDRLGARCHAAHLRLLRTPAPDVAALAIKLDLALYDRAVEFTGDAAALKAIKRDARRLAASSA